MHLPVNIKLKQIRQEDLFDAYNIEEVTTYCQHCSNYKKNYSCPDFDFNPEEYLAPYSKAVVILTEIDTQSVKAIMEESDPEIFQSRVLSNYRTELSQNVDLSSRISMYAFDTVKDQMADLLIDLEEKIPGSLSLPPGSCTRCATCLKTLGKPCRYPEKLRFSLEALGFLVSVIYRDHFNKELGWAKGQLPDQFCTCSVLMTNESIDKDLLVTHLSHMHLEIKE